jgi:putative oxygen-independent coproporphyrinogen III oxidase
MPAIPPDGYPAPPDGVLPEPARAELGTRGFGFYVHVPFCATRCGYCDFNTYTAAELGGGGSRAAYADTAIAEVRLARRVLGDRDVPVETVFFGGGTPTLLPAADLGRVLRAIDDEFGLAPGAEVTTEANPDSIDRTSLGHLRELGFTRLSLGMQSARDHVLAVLERTHTPGRAGQCVAWARGAGFDQVSLDLIYGTPGESADDWRASVDTALEAGPDHVSAYALIVEDGTRLAARIRRGRLPPPEGDVMADRYLAAEEAFAAYGLDWYEISNWARDGAARCRHNMLYWTGGDWWGIGPGAHSHVGGTRWWNVRHPAAYAARLAADESPAQAREVLDDADRRMERIMLEVRLAGGAPIELLDLAGRTAARGAAAGGLLDAEALAAGRLALTLRGRLLADSVVRDLT